MLSRLLDPLSLLPQDSHRIGIRRPSCGQPARYQRRRRQEQRDGDEHQRIGGADTEEQSLHQACDRDCPANAKQHTDDNDECTLAQHQS